MTVSMLQHAAWIARSLGRGDLFPFSEEDLRELAESIGVDRVEPGTPLLAPGNPVDWIGVIERGEVELSHRGRGRRVVLQILRGGDLLGDVPFFCRQPSPFTARTLSEVMLIRLDRADVEGLLARRPMVAQRFLYSMASRLERTQRRLLQLTGGDLRAQVATLLLDEIADDTNVVHLPQATLAELLGARRPSVNRVLKDLELEGAVHLAYRRVEVVDPSALARVAGAGARPASRRASR